MGLLTGEILLMNFMDKGDFMRRSRRCVDGDKQALKVYNSHVLRALTPFRGTHGAPPF